MFIMHVALQGCLRARNVPYGLTPDTGGHIKYLLELVNAVDAQGADVQQQIIVRQFNSIRLGAEYYTTPERVTDRAHVVRIAGATEGYVAKEDLCFELPVLADNLETHIRSLAKKPDVIHAHYADAGQLALEMKRRLGIPFVFTAHSLGRVKSTSCATSLNDPVLNARIAMEEDVIAQADRIVASSMDEAELQYGLYRSARPETIRVNPPGCDLDLFAEPARITRLVEETRDKFLFDPSKPPILAVARPVRKKNLAGLIHAYGQSSALQDAANLVIYAGTRGRIDDEAAEPCAVLTDLLKLIDQYDLWGKVALPKTHRQEDIPAIYQDACRRGGIFANIALNEPFGLTFLEAAASGLPVVATNSGGPNDILGRCQNGLLVDPTDTKAIGSAIIGLLNNPVEWERASKSGLDACGFYSWDRHAGTYLQDLEWIAAQQGVGKPALASLRCDRMLVCDIDNTLTGDRIALERLRQWLTINPHTAFGIATGRSLQSAIDIIEQWDIPAPRFLITSVGSEIYWVRDPLFRSLRRDTGWPPLGQGNWDPDVIDSVLRAFDGVRPQGGKEQRRFKRSYFLKEIERCPEVRRRLHEKGLDHELIYSHGRFLDILPQGVSKGHAIHHVAARLGIAPADIWAAGDSGNDVHMLEMVGHPIIVGNHTSELTHLKSQPRIYFAKSSYAAGVVEGLLHMSRNEMSNDH
ncbi:HAD-IIB family hydrolase [uncultured Sulfitobacter sp.]|uniref:HAD-IIB family hydrolase n=1 Tax=uncultured Sulfitobacter sp. TaxID=191468 RepID=UPI00344F7AA6